MINIAPLDYERYLALVGPYPLMEAVAKAMKGGDIRYHTVRSGDTLWGISRQYRLSVDELVRLNKMDSKAAIYPGMKLMVSR